MKSSEQYKLAIVLVAVLDTPHLLALTLRCLASLKTKYTAKLFLMGLGVSETDRQEMSRQLNAAFRPDVDQPIRKGDMEVSWIDNPNQALAASWNQGLTKGAAWGAETLLVACNDIECFPDTIDRIAAYGLENPQADFWYGRTEGKAAGMEFSLFCFRKTTLDTYGWFDENFWPVFCEDMDYDYRLWLAGGVQAVVPEATFHHCPGATCRRGEPGRVALIASQEQQNKQYFNRKWGNGAEELHGYISDQPKELQERIRSLSYTTPFGKPDVPVGWWELRATTKNNRILKVTYQDQRVAVIDNFLSPEEWQLLQPAVGSLKCFTRDVSNELGRMWNWTAQAPATSTAYWAGSGSALEQLCSLFQQVALKLKGPLQLPDCGSLRIHLQASGMGVKLRWHTDNGGCGTLNWYCHPRWEEHWGGEVVIAGEPKGEIPRASLTEDGLPCPKAGLALSITPKPNRCILVAPGVLHQVNRIDPDAGNALRLSMVGILLPPEGKSRNG